MTHKQARAFLDQHLAGWRDMDHAAAWMATKSAADPKYRAACHRALSFLKDNPTKKKPKKKTAAPSED